MTKLAYCALSARIESISKKIPCLIFFAEKIFCLCLPCLSLTALFKRQHCLCSSSLHGGSGGCCALSLLIKSNDAETKVLCCIYVC